MKIDFAKTKQDVTKYLRKQLSRLKKDHPDVPIKKLTLWGLGMSQIVHLLLESSDDKAVLANEKCEYIEQEFGPGVGFDYWPDFYSRKELEVYEFRMPDGTVRRENPDDEGDDAIERPLYELLQEILREEDFSQLNLADKFKLAVEMGNGADEVEWAYPATPVAEGSNVSAEDRERIKHLFDLPSWNDDKSFLMWTNDDLETMTWAPKNKADRLKAQAFYEAATWRRWRTTPELKALLQNEGPWLIRKPFPGSRYQFLTSNDANAIVGPEGADLWTLDAPEEAVEFTAKDAQKIILKLTKQALADDPETVDFFEPVRRDEAMTDFRLER